ncbi:MAG: SAM-dependent methyltransferase [Rhodobacteraceae bacterium]|nr:SAM-dependent methyltransferase [Paracoccaceae bacterium]
MTEIPEMSSRGSHTPAGTLSDTAAWMASFRAQESARRDRRIDDPYAARFAKNLSGRFAHRGQLAADMVVQRTVVFDELILKTIAEHAIDCVINIAAGYDTRPYRLQLPERVVWFDTDLPDLTTRKKELLDDATPKCAVEFRNLDLREAGQLAAILEDANRRASRALVITEGLLLYLPEDSVRGLAETLGLHPNVSVWLTDLMSPAARFFMNRAAARHLDHIGEILRFAPRNGPAFFAPYGWTPESVHPAFRVMQRIDRNSNPMIGAVLGAAKLFAPASLDGTVLLRRL